MASASSTETTSAKAGDLVIFVPEKWVTVTAGDHELRVRVAGYGHERSTEGDFPFVGGELMDQDQVISFTLFRNAKQSFSWKNWTIVLISTEDGGPPHNSDAPTTLMINYENKAN